MEIHLFWGQKVKDKVRSYKNIVGVGLCTLVSAGFFWLLVFLFLISEISYYSRDAMLAR